MASAGIGGRVEGLHPVRAALAAGRVRVLTVERSRRDLEDLVAEARAAGASVETVDDVRPLAQTESPQGVVARARPIPLAPLEGLLEPPEDLLIPALVVLDHLEDPRNVGAIARSALAAGMTGMVVPRRRAAPLSALAFKAAAGAFEHLPVASVSSIADCAARAGRAGVWSVGLHAHGERPLFGLELLSEPVALFVGSEGSGLARLVRARLDITAFIPVDGRVDSLNAATAAALACFETGRLRASGGNLQ